MTVESIRARIEDEYRKHPNLDWALLAAHKIHSELITQWSTDPEGECQIHSTDMSGLCFKCNKQVFDVVKTDPLTDRENDFFWKCEAFKDEYGIEMIRKFVDYWTEHGDNAKKMRFEKEKVFDIKKRLERWKRNQKNFNNGKPEKRSTESAAHSFITE